jgi:hypothetical protein
MTPKRTLLLVLLAIATATGCHFWARPAVGSIDSPVGYAWMASVCGPGPCYIDAGFTGDLSGAGGWTTVFDCDFTAQPFLSLDAGTGPYRICPNATVGASVLWDVVEQANLAWPIEVDAGLNILPNGSAVGGPPDTSAGIYTYLSTLYPAVSTSTSWRITWYENDSLSANYQFCHLYVTDLLAQTSASPTSILLSHRHNSNTNWGTEINTQGSNSQDQYSNTSTYNGSHVVQLLLPSGFVNVPYSSWAQIDGGYTWSQSTAYPLTGGALISSNGVLQQGVSPMVDWGIAITAAQNGGSGALQCQTRRLTIEVNP